jgi:F0F1-type ATP synthase assembly protein I
MGHFSSKTLIQGHALFLFLLAVYLTQAPEVITDSDIDYLFGDSVKVVSQMLLASYYYLSFTWTFFFSFWVGHMHICGIEE